MVCPGLFYFEREKLCVPGTPQPQENLESQCPDKDTLAKPFVAASLGAH